jgi:AcrR family transcriptional regulator
MVNSNAVRRRPKQARSEATVNTIYAATSQIIEREGIEKLTTNRIAEVSGFGVGTIYQYFPNRESLLVAMAIAHRDALIAEIDAVLIDSQGRSLQHAVTRMMDTLIADLRQKKKVRQGLIRMAIRKDMFPTMQDGMRVLYDHLGKRLAEIAHREGINLSPMSQFILSRSLWGVVRAILLEDSQLIDSDDMEKELAGIIWTAIRREAA